MSSQRHIEDKYRDEDRWRIDAWRRVRRLGLDTSPPLRILDLWPGSGHFISVCRSLGHRAIGLDREGVSDLLAGIRARLGVGGVFAHTISPQVPLPTDLGRFDLIAAWRCQFYIVRSEGRRSWTLKEWSFFLDDLRDNVLAPNGRFALKLPSAKSAVAATLTRNSPELIALLASRGGKTDGKAVFLFDPIL